MSQKSKRNYLGIIPNSLTLSRVILGGAAFAVGNNTVQFVVLVLLGGLTDALDGFTARQWGTSQWGALLDSVCDKIFMLTVVVAMILHFGLPVWIAGLVVIRDAGVTLLGVWLWLRKGFSLYQEIHPTAVGKSITVGQVAVLLGFLVVPSVSIALLVVLVPLSVYALYGYTKMFREVVSH